MRSIILAVFLACALPARGQHADTSAPSPDAAKIKEALAKPWGELFWIERSNGQYRMGDPASKYAGDRNFEDLTFDISNNKALANVGFQGAIKNLTIYRDSYRVAGHPKSLPGVWMAKDNSSFGPYSYKLQVGNDVYDLAQVDWDFRTGLLDNLFPVTELRDPHGRFLVRLLTFAPVSSYGAKRLPAIVYGLLLENRSSQALEGAVELPGMFANTRQDFTKHPIHMWEPFEFEFGFADSMPFERKLTFRLSAGESFWVPTVLHSPGDSTLEDLQAKGSAAWLAETWAYYRGVLGRLETPGDRYLAEFFERQVIQALQSIAMSRSGKLAGTNWGSYPATREIWMKDAYYSCLPITLLDPSLAEPIIRWFGEFGVRQKGNILPGGLNHSLSLSMASIVLAGSYYDHSADKAFFHRHGDLRGSWGDLLDQMIGSRKVENVWLFPTAYISDGAVEGDFHTGSNVVAWRALKAYARLLADVFGDAQGARRYSEIADKVHEALLKKTVVDGPFGRQFIEAVDKNGQPPRMISDGEESDTTLMPFYGFLPYDHEVYRNYMRFSMSPHNQVYQPKVRAITWSGSPATPLADRVPSTAPGYMKSIALGDDADSLFGQNGYYAEVRRITDADGSVFWWPYGWNSNPPKWDYDKPIRQAVPGKAGWFAGVHTAVFISRFLGVDYDAPNRTLKFAPSPLLGKRFAWSGFQMGKDRFSVSYAREGASVRASVTGEGGQNTRLDLILPVDGFGDGPQVTIDGKQQKASRIHYLGRDSIRVLTDLPGGRTVNVAVLDSE